MLSAVLWDMGGPIDREVEYERLIDEDMRRALGEAGVVCSDADFDAAERWAVASFAPNAYRAMVWKLSEFRADVARRVYEEVAANSERRHVARGGMELREGVDELIRAVHRKGIPQGLVTNNDPERLLADLARHGLDHCFVFPPRRDPPLRKPNPEVFLNAAAALDVAPEDCLVVGDRIDTDIVPAQQLGMTTTLFRTGRHAGQRPRTWEEVPDHEVADVAELAGLLARLGLADAEPGSG
ncbi:MAG: HAD family hydrolase [Dehalococcoidia bacterium]|nr:HAD family hydrolase [Dehalococcoidia bacterium]MYI86440.1 HAD family hydrolase [Dehalococcoidia bacterium]